MDDSLFINDNVHLNDCGLQRLTNNLDLTEKVNIMTSWTGPIKNGRVTSPCLGRFFRLEYKSQKCQQETRRPCERQAASPTKTKLEHSGGSCTRCFRRGEPGRVVDSCRHWRKVCCHACGGLGRKKKFCSDF